MTTGMHVVVDIRELGAGAVLATNVRFTEITYDPAVQVATTVVVNQNDISMSTDPLDKWTVAWTVIAADLAAFAAKSRVTHEADAKTAVNAAFPAAI